jgi:hypothetical protein
MQGQLMILLVGWFALWANGCGSDGGSSGLDDAATIAVTGVSVDEDFVINGAFSVGFVAEDASGNPLLATESATAALVSVKMYGSWKSATTKASSTVDCTVFTPAVTTCTLKAVTSTQPTQGAGNVAGSVLITTAGACRAAIRIKTVTLRPMRFWDPLASTRAICLAPLISEQVEPSRSTTRVI